jgi:hypothetical protein
MRADRVDIWEMGVGVEWSDLRGVGVIDMSPVTGLPLVDTDSPKIEAFSQCKPSRLSLWFEASPVDLRGALSPDDARFATLVTDPEFVDITKLEPWGHAIRTLKDGVPPPQRDPEDASYAVTALRQDAGGQIFTASSRCFVYLDSDFAVEAVEFYVRSMSMAEYLMFRKWAAETGQTVALCAPIDLTQPPPYGVPWDVLRAEIVDAIAGDVVGLQVMIIPTLQAMSLLAHGIATLKDPAVSRNKHVRRHSSSNIPVQTMRLYTPPGQTESDRRQSLHWRADHWAPADRGTLGRFVAKGTGQEEMVWHPGRWVGDPALGAS